MEMDENSQIKIRKTLSYNINVIFDRYVKDTKSKEDENCSYLIQKMEEELSRAFSSKDKIKRIEEIVIKVRDECSDKDQFRQNLNKELVDMFYPLK
tara:strand:+ start:314 stop:601 length:288 start_codon:yes stop_codon:yes gene_type:complete